jgi:hypothetical protein
VAGLGRCTALLLPLCGLCAAAATCMAQQKGTDEPGHQQVVINPSAGRVGVKVFTSMRVHGCLCAHRCTCSLKPTLYTAQCS